MSIFPKTVVGNLIALATAGGIVLLAASQGWPIWVGTSAIIYIAADIFVAIVRALSWLFDDRPAQCPEIRITVSFERGEKR